MIWSCLQGTMGYVYADNAEYPESAMAILGDFSFYAGKPDKELVEYKPEWCEQDFIIMVPQNEEWAKLIADAYGDRATRVTRYAFKKEIDVFDMDKLQRAVDSLDCQYTMKLFDEDTFQYVRNSDWAKDWCSQFSNYEQYEKYGLGVVIQKDGIPVAGASSYSSYRGGIEIEVDTRADYRRKGLAYICCAKLILECLSRGLYPSWDAQNKWSAALAEKLGYHYDGDYTAFEVRGYGIRGIK